MHEFIHAFGFNHEHERPDRDFYVTINKHNIYNYDKNYYNFDKAGRRDGFETFGVPYDGLSIMHYKSTEFSKDPYIPLNTIE